MHHEIERTIHRLFAVLGAVALLFGAAACGDDDVDDTGAQPDGVSDSFRPDALAAIPVPGAAEPLSAPSEKDGAVAQSYEIPGRTPEEVLAEFETDLAADGWSLASGPEAVGTGFRGEWLKEGDVLEVSATPFGAAEADSIVTQFSLVLREES